MLTITVRLDEKISTSSQYENRTAGVMLEASNLELSTPDQVLAKSAELFSLARKAVDEQLKPQAPKEPGAEGHLGNGSKWNGHPPSNGGNGHSNGNGNGRSYGRPAVEPTPKQRTLLRKLAKDRNLGPESIRAICQRIVGKDPRSLDRKDMSRLIEGLLSQEQAA